MGGISAPKNHLGILLRGKHLEFINVCGLKLEGRVYYGEEGNLSFSYCAIDNLVCDKLEMRGLNFEYSSITNLQITDSKIQGWHFWECSTDGDIINSKLSSIKVIGGEFTPFYKGTNIFNVYATHKGYHYINFEFTYSTLKTIYSNQGDETNSKLYFIAEREIYREHAKGWNRIARSFSYYYWGYGKKPHKIIYYSIAIILICALVYFLFPNYVRPMGTSKTIFDSIYLSIATFTTLGYADLSPTGWIRIIAMLEAFTGAFNLGFIIAGFSNTKY